ncbi:uncharacterized protein LOC113389650 [Ctenocephalides felis]|uniref:uncharacterized protein LOC113389650 n=1 Tax=Ctenocephalides felis TaxID=7515 RepID=UPI000E6E3605|nr:uncharacterized protein LOC113389650 [Ctenocephalides felis]
MPDVLGGHRSELSNCQRVLILNHELCLFIYNYYKIIQILWNWLLKRHDDRLKLHCNIVLPLKQLVQQNYMGKQLQKYVKKKIYNELPIDIKMASDDFKRKIK